MTAIHQFQCDRCLAKVSAHFNREHWLPPLGWVELWDNNAAKLNGLHLCDSCAPNLTAKAPPTQAPGEKGSGT